MALLRFQPGELIYYGALLCEWLSEYVWKSVCASVSFWQKIMKPYWTSCFLICNHNLFFLNLISSSLSHTSNKYFELFLAFSPPFSIFLILHFTSWTNQITCFSYLLYFLGRLWVIMTCIHAYWWHKWNCSDNI